MERRSFLGSLLGLASVPFVGLPKLPSIPPLPLGELECDQPKTRACVISNRKLGKMVIRFHHRGGFTLADLADYYRQLRWAIKQPGNSWCRMVKNGWVPSPDLETTLRACWAEDVAYLRNLQDSGRI